MKQSQLNQLIWCRKHLDEQGFNLFDGRWSQSGSWNPYQIEMRMVRENGHVFTEICCPKLEQKPLAMIGKGHFKEFVKSIKILNKLYGMSLPEYIETVQLVNN